MDTPPASLNSQECMIKIHGYTLFVAMYMIMYSYMDGSYMFTFTSLHLFAVHWGYHGGGAKEQGKIVILIAQAKELR